MVGHRARRNVAPHLAVKRRQPRGVILTEGEVAEGRGEKPAVLELRDPAAAGKLHRPARVEEDRDPGVRLLLEELDVILVGLGDELPIDRADLVGGGVGAVVGVFDARSEERAGVEAGEEPLDGRAGDELHPLHQRYPLRIEEPRRIGRTGRGRRSLRGRAGVGRGHLGARADGCGRGKKPAGISLPRGGSRGSDR